MTLNDRCTAHSDRGTRAATKHVAAD